MWTLDDSGLPASRLWSLLIDVADARYQTPSGCLPVAPLGACAIMGHASQNKVLSALRGTEVVADPTNVMALVCTWAA
jgi:hypothetical protein